MTELPRLDRSPPPRDIDRGYRQGPPRGQVCAHGNSVAAASSEGAANRRTAVIHQLKIRIRFIPARAGNWRDSPIRPRLQPRLPPRVRGTPHTEWRSSVTMRFIPARAGNSPSANRSLSPTDGSSPACGNPHHRAPRRKFAAVHPRACGELAERNEYEIADRRFIPARAGNSPPGRHSAGRDERFIPARAGNSRSRPRRIVK